MIRSQKIAILLAIPIIIGSAVIIGLVAPAAYLDLCKLRANETLNQMYVMEGGKEEFLRSWDQQNLSNKVQKELRTLNSIIAQCPELGSYSINDSRFGLVEQETKDSYTLNQASFQTF